jgi:hypothetical protein
VPLQILGSLLLTAVHGHLAERLTLFMNQAEGYIPGKHFFFNKSKICCDKFQSDEFKHPKSVEKTRESAVPPKFLSSGCWPWELFFYFGSLPQHLPNGEWSSVDLIFFAATYLKFIN